MSAAEDFVVGYFRLMNANGAAHVYREAGRAGVFRELMSGGKTAAELAEACGTVLRPTQLVLDALAPMGVVVEADDCQTYALSPLGQMLVGGSYRNLGDEFWSHLPSFLASGKPLTKMEDVAQSESHYQMQAAILGWMLSPAAQCAARLLRETLSPGAAILDVGAGSAVWSLTLAQTSDATVTAIDWKAVLEVAMETAEQMGLSTRLTTIAGNYHEVEFGTGRFDLVMLANVTHLESPEGNRHLIAKAWQALKPGGRIAIIDVLPGQSQGDLNRTLYTLGLALRTERGRVYSTEELNAILRESGCNASQLVPLEVPPFVMGMLLAGPREQG